MFQKFLEAMFFKNPLRQGKNLNATQKVQKVNK